MKFCPVCKNLMEASTTTGRLLFKCTACGQIVESQNEDTLMYENFIISRESDHKYVQFINGAAFDPTNKNVFVTCKKCGKDYMKFILFGENEKAMYLCTCGNIQE